MKVEMEVKERSFAYVSHQCNVPPTSSVASYSTGRDYGIAKRLLQITEQAMRFHLTPEGEDA
jgi:hypothetical protein